MSGPGLAAGNNGPAEVWEPPPRSSLCPNPITTSRRARTRPGLGWRRPPRTNLRARRLVPEGLGEELGLDAGGGDTVHPKG